MKFSVLAALLEQLLYPITILFVCQEVFLNFQNLFFRTTKLCDAVRILRYALSETALLSYHARIQMSTFFCKFLLSFYSYSSLAFPNISIFPLVVRLYY